MAISGRAGDRHCRSLLADRKNPACLNDARRRRRPAGAAQGTRDGSPEAVCHSACAHWHEARDVDRALIRNVLALAHRLAAESAVGRQLEPRYRRRRMATSTGARNRRHLRAPRGRTRRDGFSDPPGDVVIARNMRERWSAAVQHPIELTARSLRQLSARRPHPPHALRERLLHAPRYVVA